MKIEFSPTDKPAARILTGYLMSNEEFHKLGTEDRQVLIWALLKEPKETNELIDMWRFEYQDKFSINLNVAELQTCCKKAISFLKEVPLKIQELVSSTKRLQAYIAIVNFEGPFSLAEVNSNCRHETSKTTFQNLLRGLCFRGVLRQFEVKRDGGGQPMVFYEKVESQKKESRLDDQKKPEKPKKSRSTDFLRVDSIEAMSLLKIMNGSNEFRQLDKEDQFTLLFSMLKHPNTVQYLIDSWVLDYAEKLIQINATRLLAHVKESLVLCNSTTKEESVKTRLLRNKNMCNAQC